MLQVTASDSNKRLSVLVKKFLPWFPIIVGIIHQFLMAFFGIEGIYVFVNPPQYIHPWASLEYQWWIVLTFVTSLMYILMYLNRLPSVPRRIMIPTFVYLLFLLILVKPI